MLRPARGQLEREFQDAVHAVPGHHRFLNDDLAVGALEHAATDGRILALGVLANDHAVDVAGRKARQRGSHAGHQAARPQVHVLVELAAKLQQGAPQRHMVRYARRPADRAEENRIVTTDPITPVGRHHRAVLFVVVAAGEVEVIQLQTDVETPRSRIERPQAFGHDFAPDAVAGDHGDPVCGRHLASNVGPIRAPRDAHAASHDRAALDPIFARCSTLLLEMHEGHGCSLVTLCFC